MVESAGQKSLPECYISNGPRYYGPMYSPPSNTVEYMRMNELLGKEQWATFDTARGEDCRVRFRDIFGVEHMIDYSDKNKQYRDPITIWVPVEPVHKDESEWFWYDECGKKR